MFSKNFSVTPTPEEWEILNEGVKSGRIKTASDAELARFVLRSLINHIEEFPEQDFWIKGLSFALACVEEKIEKV